MRSRLYIVATPIGNRDDITLRAIATLKEATILFAEDTRETKKLLELCGISLEGKKIFSYASHNLKESTDFAIRFLEDGKNVVLVTDRGTPAISDPGERLVSAARERGFDVVPIPGASSLTTLLSVSGLSTKEVLFVGFLGESSERKKLWTAIKSSEVPAVFFESPKRIRETAQELKDFFGAGRLFLGREMTKIHEEFLDLELSELNPASLPDLGEYAVLFVPPQNVVDEGQFEKEIEIRLASDKEWSKEMAKRFGKAASDWYNALQQKKASRIKKSN